MRNIKIDFIGIGSQKAGTTWILPNLTKLPITTLRLKKEIHYFDRVDEYPTSSRLRQTSLISRIRNVTWIKHTVIDVYKSLFSLNFKQLKWDTKYNFSHFNEKWYLSIFEPLASIKDEIPPSYSILKPKEIKKMHQLSLMLSLY